MNILKNKVYLIVSVILVIIVVFVILIANNFQQAELPKENGTLSQTETSEEALPEYPRNLLEGEIISIDANAKIIIMRARLFKIDSDLDEAERTIKVDKAEVVIYNLDTGTETPSDISELKEGDGVLVTTEESSFGVVATRLQYTAAKITKIIKNENL